MIDRLPAFGICGYSGSGKTTLIRQIIPRLKAMGLDVAVLKHDAHGLTVDRRGKDSDVCFNAGADVMATDARQTFYRAHQADQTDLFAVLKCVAPRYDMVLVEGYKAAALPHKIWLRRHAKDKYPPKVKGVRLDLERDADRVTLTMNLLARRLPKIWTAAPVCAGILIGGQSTRMGRPKHLIRHEGHTWLEWTIAKVRPFVSDIALLGSGEVPRKLDGVVALPDVRDAEGRNDRPSGPLAGMLAAMRWQPLSSWLFIACDLPWLSGTAVEWLLTTRKPGVWATLPRLRGSQGVEPLLAHYDFRARHLLEACRGPAEIAASRKVITPEPPESIVAAWTNINTPTDLRRSAP